MKKLLALGIVLLLLPLVSAKMINDKWGGEFCIVPGLPFSDLPFIDGSGYELHYNLNKMEGQLSVVLYWFDPSSEPDWPFPKKIPKDWLISKTEYVLYEAEIIENSPYPEFNGWYAINTDVGDGYTLFYKKDECPWFGYYEAFDY